MTNQLVEDPYFPHAFPYIYNFYQEHSAILLPDHEEENDANAMPILVQIPPFHDNEIAIEEPEEDPRKIRRKTPGKKIPRMTLKRTPRSSTTHHKMRPISST
ncbi:hypothetical protein RHMOL_Rhmol01G0183400 [Rhododendron molle]|uniref:Uncharacterized protein n=1 Tax=Rhododendron molle TaxID=49168 RepID=A0ACC0Q4B1_RHOML|nr:hypothetical protein RHMOL_Rhmol01G0183400 [Rhododendron molle]